MTSDVEITIDVLSLHGLGGMDANAVRAGVEAELGRLLQERGLPGVWSQPRSQRSLDAGTFAWDAAASPGGVAASIAQRLYEGLSR